VEPRSQLSTGRASTGSSGSAPAHRLDAHDDILVAVATAQRPKASDRGTLNLEAKLTVGMTRPPLNVPRGILLDPFLSFHLASPSAVKRQL
jgi:hypothetical protein